MEKIFGAKKNLEASASRQETIKLEGYIFIRY